MTETGPNEAVSRAGVDPGVPDRGPGTPRGLDGLASRLSIKRRTLLIGTLIPLIALVVVAVAVAIAPANERAPIVLGTLVALAAGLAAASVGVYGGVLVPGLLLLGIDARFAAAVTLFLQLGVIPIAAGSHYRMGNFSWSVATPLLIGGVVGAFIGPFFAALLPKDLIARVVAVIIVVIGLLVLMTRRVRGLGEIRANDDVPRRRVAGIGLTAGFSSGISGAGWGPIGVTMLILSRIDPRQAIGSSLFARLFMAAAAVAGFLTAQTALHNVTPNWWIVVPIFAGSIAPIIPGALLVSRLGRDRATVAITLLSIALALPSVIWPH